jgi:hypothetical protein
MAALLLFTILFDIVVLPLIAIDRLALKGMTLLESGLAYVGV